MEASPVRVTWLAELVDDLSEVELSIRFEEEVENVFEIEHDIGVRRLRRKFFIFIFQSRTAMADSFLTYANYAVLALVLTSTAYLLFFKSGKNREAYENMDHLALNTRRPETEWLNMGSWEVSPLPLLTDKGKLLR